MENIETIVIDDDVIVIDSQDDEHSEEENSSKNNSNKMDMEIDVDEILPRNNVTIAEQKKNDGNDQYKAQNYKAALKLYSDAISMCPDTAAYYGNRAACYMMLADYKAALVDSKHAISLDNKFEKGYVRMAKCCLMMGDIVGTEQTIQKLLEIDPQNTSLKSELHSCKQLRDLEQRANASYEKKDYRTTIFQMDSALKIAPACHRYKLLKAECLALLGRLDEAGSIAVTAMKSDTTCADAAYVRGLCLYFNDNLDKGLAHFERVLQLDPDHKKAKMMRLKTRSLKEKKEKGNELYKTGRYREAHTIYTEALAIDDQNKDINSKLFYNRALVNYKIGNIRDAIADCSKALENNSAYMKAILLRAKCHNNMENYEDCVRDYETALKMEKTTEIRNLLKDAKLSLKKSKRKDYYKILGVTKDDNEDAIKKAYRKRALIHHPDRHANSSDDEKKEHEKKFKEVGEAYSILSDPQKKARYDNGQDMDEYNNMEFDPNQMFRQFFFTGGTGGGNGNGNYNFNFNFN